MTDTTFPIQLYTTSDGSIQIDVQLDGETLRLNQKQLSNLFDVDRTVITKHINNIIKEGELISNSVSAKFAHTWDDGKVYQVMFYNLDMIISLWYRVNSQRATHFRIWATNILKQYLIKWYALNEPRLNQVWVVELQKSLAIIRRALGAWELSNNESRGLVELMTLYIPSLITLHQYDTDTFQIWNLTNKQKYIIDKDEAEQLLLKLKQELIAKNEASDLFGLVRTDGLDAIFGALYQWFDGRDLYQSVEEKAANLLYLVIKNHPFVDGNKRSGAFLFVRYLNKNDILKDNNGAHKINEITLVALALLVAMSNPQEKSHIVKLIIALLS